MRTLTILLILSLPSLGQTLTFMDDSPSDSPLTWDGFVTYDQNNQASCALTGHNNASRMIVAYRIQFDITGPDGLLVSMKHRDDHFFKPQELLVETSPQPKLNYQFPDFCDLYLSTQPGVKFDNSLAHIKTIFAQLDDGTTWGAKDIVQEIMWQRTTAIAYLKSLAAAYESGGASALAETLKQGPGDREGKATHPPGLVPVITWNEVMSLRQLPDATSQMQRINADLALAETRAAWLK